MLTVERERRIVYHEIMDKDDKGNDILNPDANPIPAVSGNHPVIIAMLAEAQVKTETPVKEEKDDTQPHMPSHPLYQVNQ